MGCCIYRIRNKINGMIYIGASDLSRKPSDSAKRRWEEHKKCARNGVKKVLYDAIREFGVENFEMRFVEACPDRDTMFRREVEIIDASNSWYPNGYNVRKGRQPRKA